MFETFYWILGLLIFGIITFKKTGRIKRELEDEIRQLNRRLMKLEGAVSSPPEEVHPIEKEEEKQEEEQPEVDVRVFVPKAPAPMEPVPTWSEAAEPPKTPPSSPQASQPGFFDMMGEKWRAFVKSVDWEQFTGVKLFAWIGGAALVVGAGFFVKYSIDRNLISPETRLAIGTLVGLGMVVASLRIKDKARYAMSIHSLAAGGVAVLYAVVFAATLYYQLLPKPVGFGFISLISFSTLVLSVYHGGRFISVLGALGAYATPVMIHTGQGNLIGLLGYLTVVNLGIFEVIRRTDWKSLWPLATTGTVLLLGATAFSRPVPLESMTIAGVGIANLYLFLGFISWSSWKGEERALKFSVSLLFIAQLVLALVLTERAGAAPLIAVTATAAAAIVLGYVRGAWSLYAITFNVWGFIPAAVWAVRHFDVGEPSVAMLIFLVYGMVGGFGPLLLIMRHGVEPTRLKWLKVFPAALVALGFAALFKVPVASFWLWPLLMALHAVGLIISVVVGSMLQVVILGLLLLGAGFIWVVRVPWPVMETGFYFTVLLAGLTMCVLTVVALFKIPGWLKKKKSLESLASLSSASPTIPLEWLAGLPALGPFLLLSMVLLRQQPILPNPAMATAVALLTGLLVLARRLGATPLLGASLLAMVVTQASWAFRVPHGDLLNGTLLAWSGVLWVAAWLLPNLAFRPEKPWRDAWGMWALFEVAQFFFMAKAADGLWDRQIMGWFPLAFAVLKLPVVSGLLKRLEGTLERNVIVAFHGGVLLFYLSSAPYLLLDAGWLGAALVIEAAALLWLNRRVEHLGLRWVASVLAPVGLVLLMANFSSLHHLDDLRIWNAGVLSVALCVAALAAAVRWASFPQPQLGHLDLRSYFLWWALGAGFWLVNLLVNETFGNAPRTMWDFGDQLLAPFLSYSVLWSIFGGAMWLTKSFPRSVRIAGLVVLSSGWLRMIAYPFLYATEIGVMSPFVNVSLLAFVMLLVWLTYLAVSSSKGAAEHSWAKSWFITMAVTTGVVALTVQLATVFDHGVAFTWSWRTSWLMSVAGGLAWFVYGAGLVLWPKPLANQFRIAGGVLVVIGMIRLAWVPLGYSEVFATMTPVMNWPSAAYAVALLGLLTLTWRASSEPMVLMDASLSPKAWWGAMFTVMAFYVLNVEVASFFGAIGVEGQPTAFSFFTHGRVAQGLAYSVSWLFFALGLLVFGLKRSMAASRWVAFSLFAITVGKVFFKDMASLDQLYRVASFIVLAVIFFLVSFLYQRNTKGASS